MPSQSTAPTSPSKTQRLLDLLAYLVSHHFPVPRGQIWDHVVGYRQKLDEGADEASVRRTFERDKKELLEMGFPLETVPVPGNDADEQHLYRLRGKDFYLPYVRLLKQERGERKGDDEGPRARARSKSSTTPLAGLDPETAFSAARSLRVLAENPELPFQAEAASAYRKLTFDLEGDVDAIFGPRPVVVPGDDGDTRALIPPIARAVRARRVLRFTYHGIERDEPTEREVEPWSLLYKQSRWYLVGHDRTRDARRVFRVSRILDLEAVSDGEPDFDAPEVDLAEWDTAEAWDLPGMEEPATDALVRFRFPRSLWAERNDAGELVREDDDGSAIRRFSVRSPGPFVRWILGQLDEAEIMEPDALVEEAARLRRRVIDANPSLFQDDGLPREDAEDEGPEDEAPGHEDAEDDA